MRLLGAVTLAIGLALGACDRPAAPGSAPGEAPASTQPAQTGGALTDADRAVLLSTLELSANAQGQVRNECGDWVTPTIAPAELGGAVGAAILVAIGGGPTMATCYGDGPDLHLMLRDGAGFREVYAARGRMLVILPATTGGVRDIADGGPGFSFPLWQWNGSRYVDTNREVSDAEIANATFLP
jgi:hypothetical protein